MANPEISSTVPTPNGPMSGTSTDVKAFNYAVFGFCLWKKDSKHTFEHLHLE
jgi:long-chain fatty acid transport protein